MNSTLCILEQDPKRLDTQTLPQLMSLFVQSDFLVLQPQAGIDSQRPIQLRGNGAKHYKVTDFSSQDTCPHWLDGFDGLHNWLKTQNYQKVLRVRPDGYPLNTELIIKFWQHFWQSGLPYGCVATWNAFLPGLLIDAWNPSTVSENKPQNQTLFPDGHLYLPGTSYEYVMNLEDRAFFFDTHFANLFSTPHTLQIELASVCNSRCPKCLFHGSRSPLYHPRTAAPPFMETDLFKKLIDEFSTFKPRTGLAAALSYRGESFLHPDFFQLLAYTRKKGVRAVVNTNGKLLSKDNVLKLLDLDVTAISISLDTLDPAKHRKLQGCDIHQVARNLDFLLAEKARRGLQHPVLTSISVISAENEAELPKLLDFLLARCEQVAAFGYMDITKRSISAPHTYFTVPERYPCPHPWEMLAVLASGKVIRCGYDLNHETVLGDLNHESIMNVWNSDKMQTDRRNMCRGYYERGNICSDCPRWQAVYKRLSLHEGIMVSTQWEGKTLQLLSKNYNRDTLSEIFSDRPQSVALPRPIAEESR